MTVNPTYRIVESCSSCEHSMWVDVNGGPRYFYSKLHCLLGRHKMVVSMFGVCEDWSSKDAKE